MISDSLLSTFAQKYDEFDAYDSEKSKAEYRKIMQDPERAREYKEKNHQRVKQYREKIKKDPSLEVAQHFKERAKQDIEARRALRTSDTLDALVYKLQTQLADAKKNFKLSLLRTITREQPEIVSLPNAKEVIESLPIYKTQMQKFESDVMEFYSLRDKAAQFATTLSFNSDGKTITNSKPEMFEVMNMCQRALLKSFSKAISTTINNIILKLNEISAYS